MTREQEKWFQERYGVLPLSDKRRIRLYRALSAARDRVCWLQTEWDYDMLMREKGATLVAWDEREGKG